MAETNSNNFKQLEKEQIEEFVEQQPSVPPQLEFGVMGNVRVFSFMGDILELYLPRVFDLFISLVGGRRSDDDDFVSGDQKPD